MRASAAANLSVGDDRARNHDTVRPSVRVRVLKLGGVRADYALHLQRRCVALSYGKKR